MNSIDSNSIVDLIFQMRWKSSFASHTDCYQASKVNVWRDFLPDILLDSLQHKEPGENIELNVQAGEVIPAFDKKNIKDIKNHQFDPRVLNVNVSKPSAGRFYPKGFIAGVDGIFIEVHPEPDKALCDAASQLPLDQLETFLKPLIEIHYIETKYRSQ